MTNHLDRQIEHLEHLVDKHLKLNRVAHDGTRCGLAADIEESRSHKFLAALPKTSSITPGRFCNFDESHELCHLCRLFSNIPSNSVEENKDGKHLKKSFD